MSRRAGYEGYRGWIRRRRPGVDQERCSILQMSADGTIVLVCGTGIDIVDAGHVGTGQQAECRDGESAEK